MPELTLNGTPYDAPEGKRLVLAIEDNGIRIGHRCGGFARCTTCRVEFLEGEPVTMTEAEYNKLKEADLLGHYRLSCQIVCTHDMDLRTVMTADSMPEWEGDTGPRPEDVVTPAAEWYPKEELVEKDV
jgi:ferredoxin